MRARIPRLHPTSACLRPCSCSYTFLCTYTYTYTYISLARVLGLSGVFRNWLAKNPTQKPPFGDGFGPSFGCFPYLVEHGDCGCRRG